MRHNACTCDDANTRGATFSANCSNPELIGPASGCNFGGNTALISACGPPEANNCATAYDATAV